MNVGVLKDKTRTGASIEAHKKYRKDVVVRPCVCIGGGGSQTATHACPKLCWLCSCAALRGPCVHISRMFFGGCSALPMLMHAQMNQIAVRTEPPKSKRLWGLQVWRGCCRASADAGILDCLPSDWHLVRDTTAVQGCMRPHAFAADALLLMPSLLLCHRPRRSPPCHQPPAAGMQKYQSAALVRTAHNPLGPPVKSAPAHSTASG